MINKNLSLNNYNFYLIVIYIFWILSILSYFFLNEYVKAGNLVDGVKLGNDSALYLREAQNILNGESSILGYKSKFGYLLFLIPFLYFDLPLINVVFFNLLLTGISAWCLYKISTKYYCKLAGLICVMLFLFYFPIQIRNFYLLTEILFIDLSLILTFFIVFYKKQYIPLIIFLIIALVSIRPNGILFVFSLIFCTLYFLIEYKKKVFLILFLITLLILAIPTIHLINEYFENLNLIKSLNKVLGV